MARLGTCRCSLKHLKGRETALLFQIIEVKHLRILWFTLDGWEQEKLSRHHPRPSPSHGHAEALAKNDATIPSSNQQHAFLKIARPKSFLSAR